MLPSLEALDFLFPIHRSSAYIDIKVISLVDFCVYEFIESFPRTDKLQLVAIVARLELGISGNNV